MEIRLIVLDVDGTLTDGGILIGSNTVEVKQFQGKDGLIVRALPKLGIKTMILTGRNSELTKIRADDLHISHVLQGVDDKLSVLKFFLAEHNISPDEVAYIGDDLNDYAAMNYCGFKACPNDATDEIKAICDYVSSKDGGRGAVRDCCEALLRKCGRYEEWLALFGAI